MSSVLIVGGGASGLMAAITAARCGATVTVLEQNEKPGRKLLATGNGKCNLTNLDLSGLCVRSEDPAFIHSVIAQFPPEEIVAFFNALGLRTIDRDGWVYPATEQATQVLELLLMEAERLGVKIKTREIVSGIRKELTETGKRRFLTQTATWEYASDTVILACGSPASAVKGSSDTAAVLAEALRLDFIPFLPALVPLKIRGNFASRWAGTRVYAKAMLVVDGEELLEDEGEVQLTEYGISGIPVFQLSRFAVRAIETGHDTRILLNFLPDLTEEELTDELMNRLQAHPDRSMAKMLVGLLPDRLIPVITGEDSGRDLKNLSLMELGQRMEELAWHITHFEVEIRGAAALSQAQVCSGGIRTEELNEHMECQRIPGLYVTGEAVDMDGACGGYNLTWAWASGFAAGRDAARR